MFLTGKPASSVHLIAGRAELGFDYFYGFVGGDTDQFHPALVENKKRIEPPETNEDGSPYHFTTDIADKAIRMMRASKAVAPQRPFFVYFATGATHAPHQVPAEWIAKIQRQVQLRLGRVPAGDLRAAEEDGHHPTRQQTLTARPRISPRLGFAAGGGTQRLRPYDGSLCRLHRPHRSTKWADLIDAVDEMGELDNTLVIYMAGDNGSSAEGGLSGLLNEMTFFNAIPEPLDQKIAAIEHAWQ